MYDKDLAKRKWWWTRSEEGKQDRPDSLGDSILGLLCSQLRHQNADLEQANTSLRRENENLANEVVDLHARLRAYEDVAGELARNEAEIVRLQDEQHATKALLKMTDRARRCRGREIDSLRREKTTAVNALEDAADTLQWLAAGQEIVYAHDVDVVARGMRDALRELGDA